MADFGMSRNNPVVVLEQLQVKSSVELIKINLKERMDKICEMAFEERSQTDAEMLEAAEQEDQQVRFGSIKKAWGLENWMFGDVAVIIELYNSIVPCYKTGTRAPRKTVSRRLSGKKKRAAEPVVNESKLTEVTLTSLEYESFVEMMNGENKELFVRLVRNLLFIFINCEQVFGVSWTFM